MAKASNALASVPGLQGGMTTLLTRGPEHFREIARKSWNITKAKRKKRVAEVRENLKKANIARDQYWARLREQKEKGTPEGQLIEFVRNSKNPRETARKLLGAVRYHRNEKKPSSA